MVGERDIVGEWSMDVADVAKVGAKVKWQWVVCVSFYAPEKIICAWMGFRETQEIIPHCIKGGGKYMG